MNDELPRLQEQVYYGQINSHTDVLDKFLSESGIQRYNPQVQQILWISNIVCVSLLFVWSYFCNIISLSILPFNCHADYDK